MNTNCVELNELNDTTVWTNNSRDSPLNALLIGFPVLSAYNEWTVMSGNESILYYRYCGPLIMLLKLIAEYINREYVLKKYK